MVFSKRTTAPAPVASGVPAASSPPCSSVAPSSTPSASRSSSLIETAPAGGASYVLGSTTSEPAVRWTRVRRLRRMTDVRPRLWMAMARSIDFCAASCVLSTAHTRIVCWYRSTIGTKSMPTLHTMRDALLILYS